VVARVRGVRGSKEVGSNGLTLRMGGEREAVALRRRFLSPSIHNTTAESDEFGNRVEQPENAAFVRNQGAGKANSCLLLTRGVCGLLGDARTPAL
jgi:hypothetical protein